MEPDESCGCGSAAAAARAPCAATAEDALQNLLAVQAQEFPYARWTLAQRTRGRPPRAATWSRRWPTGRILRTHILRPTWHFVHRDDLPLAAGAVGAAAAQANAGTYRRTGIDAARRGTERRSAGRGRGRRRAPDAGAAGGGTAAAGFAAKGLELAYLIMHAEVSGVLASGSPVRSAGGALRQTYALFDERVPAGRPVAAWTRPEALAELARRYFTSRGPATVKDCADWSGLTMADVRRGWRWRWRTTPGHWRRRRSTASRYYFRRRTVICFAAARRSSGSI